MHVSVCYVALLVFTAFLTRALKWVMFISSSVATSLKFNFFLSRMFCIQGGETFSVEIQSL